VLTDRGAPAAPRLYASLGAETPPDAVLFTFRLARGITRRRPTPAGMTRPTDTVPADETLIFGHFDIIHLTCPRCRKSQVKRGIAIANLANLGSMGRNVVVTLHPERNCHETVSCRETRVPRMPG
jgi:hypothetical protein